MCRAIRSMWIWIGEVDGERVWHQPLTAAGIEYALGLASYRKEITQMRS